MKIRIQIRTLDFDFKTVDRWRGRMDSIFWPSTQHSTFYFLNYFLCAHMLSLLPLQLYSTGLIQVGTHSFCFHTCCFSRMGMQALPTGATTAWTQPGALQPGQQIASAVAAQQSAPAPAPPPTAAAMIPAYPTLHQFQVKQHPAPVQASAWPLYDHLHHHHHHLHHQHHGGYEANELSILKMATSWSAVSTASAAAAAAETAAHADQFDGVNYYPTKLYYTSSMLAPP